MKSSQFQPNEVWVVFRASDKPFVVEGKPCDVYILMDAASTFVFGQVIVPRGSKPDTEEIAEVLASAQSMKDQWARGLFLTDDSATARAFSEEAQRQGLEVEEVPLKKLRPIVGDFMRSFAETFFGR